MDQILSLWQEKIISAMERPVASSTNNVVCKLCKNCFAFVFCQGSHAAMMAVDESWLDIFSKPMLLPPGPPCPFWVSEDSDSPASTVHYIS
jgi:hypothetical protein